ncbi:FAD-dependent oxidoreductase [Hyella patelloides LEGE 07179]|uniref:FAD-dependent oxidoreductase n=1 Tax=Hyella patelloides LEGE 07179 TaxID=945734 RepID=A0A563VQQ5_9CYAN|nr:N-methyl-L-tryptophan oxidase [Hyella patelloides]VEP13741.1 FAD-dependent oxidoreductase [Hyella patelloides LEGE 07179]
MAQQFDAIVLGAGGMGSAAAYYLAKSGQKVLLLEQFELNHQKGSSYGVSRVIRYTYDNPIYIDLMRAAYPLWFALEEAAKEQLYVKTGGLDFGFPSQESFQTLKQSMDEAKLDYEYLEADEVSQRFPQFHLDDGMAAFFQAEAGLLRASRCVLAHTRLAEKLGATIRDRTPVTKIIPYTSSVEVQTKTETYLAERLVITAGSWSKALLAKQGINLPLKIMPCQLGFYQPKEPAAFKPESFPVFFAHMNGDYGEMPYGIPHEDESIGVKVTTFYGWQTVDRPSEVDYTPSEEWVERIRNFSRQYIPGAAGETISTRRCLYTLTPDKHFVVDRHPHYSHIVLGAGFSGHGFKFSTLIGKMLTELALEGKTQHDTSLFKLSRFQ